VQIKKYQSLKEIVNITKLILHCNITILQILQNILQNILHITHNMKY